MSQVNESNFQQVIDAVENRRKGIGRAYTSTAERFADTANLTEAYAIKRRLQSPTKTPKAPKTPKTKTKQPKAKPVATAPPAMPPVAVGNSTTFQAEPQTKSEPAQSARKLDDSLLTGKAPSADIDKAQRIGTPGETIPIVFGKRVSGNGGVWVQPSLVKSGSRLFVPSFLYAISQGDIASSPVTHRAWVGTKRVAFVPNVSVTLTHSYITAAALAAAPTVCPIDGNTLFCGIETFSFLYPITKAQPGAIFQQLFPATGYFGEGTITLGIGDTENTVFFFTNPDEAVFRSDTGADVTSAWKTFFNISGAIEFVENSEIVNGQIKGRAVGTILSFIDDPVESFAKDIVPDLANDAYLVFINICDRVDTQIDPLQPESTGTLFGTQTEDRWSPFEDPTDTPTADNSAYADTTFLRVVGDITERESDENGRSLTPKQLSIYYEQGVKVYLYSEDGGTGASNQLVDLVMYLFTIYKQADGAATADIASPIFTGNMLDIVAFCNEYSLHYNGVLDETVNIIEFASAISPYFLLSFISNAGQYRFEPLLPLTGNEIKVTALTPAATFTEDNILPGSFSKSYKSTSERQPTIAVMLYREANPSEIGIQRTVEVAFSDTSADAPSEQFDLTNFCTNSAHAEIYGKHEIARRHYSTHSISFQTQFIETTLIPTSIIKVERNRINSRGDDRTETEWYQVTAIRYGSDGTGSIEAEHFPVTSDDISVISDAIINGSFRVLL